MKRKILCVPLGAAVVLATALAVSVTPSAFGITGANGPDQRIAQLESKMKIVQADLKSAKATIAKLNASVGTINGVVNTAAGAIKCLSFGALGVGQYGGATPAPHGYLYTQDGSAVFLTSALDLVPAGSAPGAYVAAVDPTCIKTSAARATADSSGREARPIVLAKLRLAH